MENSAWPIDVARESSISPEHGDPRGKNERDADHQRNERELDAPWVVRLQLQNSFPVTFCRVRSTAAPHGYRIAMAMKPLS